MKKTILIILMMLILAGVVQAQTDESEINHPPSWSMEIDSALVYVGSDVNGEIYGPVGAEFSLYLVNQTSWTSILMEVTNTSYTGNRSFSFEVWDEIIPPGKYQINVTSLNWIVAEADLTIIYSEAYLKAAWEEDVDKSLGAFERFSEAVVDGIKDIWAEIGDVKTFQFVLFALVLYNILDHWVEVKIPRIIRWLQCNKAKGFKKMRASGIKANILEWHDTQGEKIPKEFRPNLTRVHENLGAAGFTEAEITVISRRVHGNEGISTWDPGTREENWLVHIFIMMTVTAILFSFAGLSALVILPIYVLMWMWVLGKKEKMREKTLGPEEEEVTKGDLDLREKGDEVSEDLGQIHGSKVTKPVPARAPKGDDPKPRKKRKIKKTQREEIEEELREIDTSGGSE